MRTVQKRMRSIQDIRTLSGARNRLSLPHRGYMRIACLELERFRRNKERESASGRMQRLDARFQEIEAEQAAILAMMDKNELAASPRRASNSGLDMQQPSFKLKY